jgi:hypothetical protein
MIGARHHRQKLVVVVENSRREALLFPLEVVEVMMPMFTPR